MVYRSKSPERALAEIKAQVDRYGVRRMEITDNILDMQYFKSVIPQLAATENRAEFFWETKANMSRENVRLMASAGVRWIQPGIESLSDRTLKLMRKGSTQLQNVQLLKYCTESGVRITWNWLFGFPGEDESELDKLANDVRAIHHLQAPSGTSVLYLEKFAPYHSSPEEWGLTGIKPATAYAYVYPFAPESLDRIAFFFECDHFSAKEKGVAFGKLRKIVDGWRSAYPRSHFLAIPRRRSMILLDTRPCAKRFFRRLTGLQHRIYEYCWKIRGERDVQRAFEGEAPAEKISAILQSFVDDYLMLGGNGRYLALATDPRMGYRAFPRVFPGGSIAHGQPAPPRNEGPRAPRRRLGRRLLNVLTLRTPPQAAARNFVMRRALAWGRTARAPYEIGEGPDAPRRDEGAMPAPEPSV
jgi:ribosomal peptide maturation radical SAM protein 1